MKKLGKLVSVLTILLCLVGITNVSAEYINKINQKEIEIAVLNQVEEAKKEEQEEQKKKEEEQRKQQEQEQQIQVQRTQSNQTYSEQLSGNNIIIPGVLSKNLATDDGSNFYLDHDINGNYNGIGVPYKDFRTNFYTRKTIIYAHSTPSGNGPFNGLQNYHNNPGYYSGHRYITVNYNGSTYTYQIFSVYVSTANSDEDEGLEYFYIMNYSDEAWANKIQEYKNKSEYETGVPVSGNDKILILQTCSMDGAYYERYYRYNLLIMAKLV